MSPSPHHSTDAGESRAANKCEKLFMRTVVRVMKQQPVASPTLTETERRFAQHASYSYRERLDVDPDAARNVPNRESREVRSGHYVPVKPTPLPLPALVIASEDLAKELQLELPLSEPMVRFLGADSSAIPEFDFSWATPYALAIYGQPMYRQDPFGNGRGYGDGRAISIAEVLLDNGKRWELQLKGAGGERSGFVALLSSFLFIVGTPFRRGGDGRAVLRSSIREFLASEAMRHLGVRTTRALSLVVSGRERVSRPWFSPDSGSRRLPSLDDPRLAHLPLKMREMLLAQLGQQQQDPDVMITEPCAITCRVASSFVRVGHVDLFARRARGETPGVFGNARIQDMSTGLEQLVKMVEFAMFREFPECKTPIEFLRASSQRIAELTANWIRVGFCQGNFNSDNCLVSGTQMDYGPFGFIERYDPMWNMWVGGGEHFAFMNQPRAGHENFKTLVGAVMPILNDAEKVEAEELAENHFAVATDALNEVWRRKLGLAEWTSEAQQLISELLELMEECKADYTLTWRQLGEVAEAGKGDSATFGAVFYELLNGDRQPKWNAWLAKWLQLKPDVATMRAANPVVVPREWMLVDAYERAYQGDYSGVEELHQLFRNPYTAPEPVALSKFARRAPEAVLGKPGTAYMT